MKCVRYFLPLVVMTVITAMVVLPASAVDFATPEMQRTWEYTDKPVADGQAIRSWI